MPIVRLTLLFNAVALFCVFNPWTSQWEGAGLVLLTVEGAFLVLVAVPLFVYYRRNGQGNGTAIRSTLQAMWDFVAGWA